MVHQTGWDHHCCARFAAFGAALATPSFVQVGQCIAERVSLKETLRARLLCAASIRGALTGGIAPTRATPAAGLIDHKRA
jgi:hypothetical protein